MQRKSRVKAMLLGQFQFRTNIFQLITSSTFAQINKEQKQKLYQANHPLMAGLAILDKRDGKIVCGLRYVKILAKCAVVARVSVLTDLTSMIVLVVPLYQVHIVQIGGW